MAQVVITLFEARRDEIRLTQLGKRLDQSANEIYQFDATTLRFTYVNASAQCNLQYPLDDLLRLTPVDIKPAYTAAQFDALLAPLRAGRQTEAVFETEHQRRDGLRYPVEVRLQLYAQEHPPVFVAVLNDITQRKAAETALRKKKNAPK